ncbi:MAG TPA: GYF domain-containing protein, partial [Rhodothermales bacterium]|nr:GYF domain-containing protein [Rhodothermales bacterium]
MSQVYDPEWYVGGPDASRGPLSRPALLLLRALGALADAAPVWKPGLAAWTPAGEQPELASPDGGDAAPATDEATGWYVAKSGGTRTGPYADATLRELAGAGLLPADWLVWRHGQPDWSPAALAGFTPAPPIANADRSPVAAGSAAPPPLRPRGVAGPVATGTWPGAPSYPAGPDRAPLRPRRTSPGKVAIAAVGGVLFCCFAYVVGTGSAGRQIPERWPSAFATDAPAIAPDTTTPAYTEDLLHDMILAHNYMVAQQASLQHIKDGHGGAIGGRATGLRDHFERSFRPSVENIDRLLSAFEPTEWDAARSSAEQQLDAMLGPLSAAEAEAFLDEVEGRMNGTMEPGVFETLLTFHPLYRDYPEQEMHMGFTRQFLSDSLTTNPLAHVELAYPASWQAEASDQP